MTDARIEIRPCETDDLDEIYKICLATAANGADASDLYADPKLIGHIYAAPYALFSAGCGFVVQDPSGVGGYILGALDTPTFEARLEEAWWPTLRPLYSDPSGKPAAAWTADEMRSWQIHHPRRTPEWIAGPYPSHLHIDLLPRLQGRGVGRRLMDHWLAAMKALGSTGAHLGVPAANITGVRFYRAYGWRELASEPARRGRTMWFGMRL